MFKNLQTIEFTDFLLDTESKTPKQRYSLPVGKIAFSQGEGERSATMSLNNPAAIGLGLKLSNEEIAENRAIEDAIDGFRPSNSEMEKLTKEELKALKLKIANARAKKHSRSIAMFKGKSSNGEAVVSLCNSSKSGSEIPESKRQRVSNTLHTVKLPSKEVKDLYEICGLPTGENFQDAKDMVFELEIGTTTPKGTTIAIPSCYFIPLQEAICVEKEAPVRSEKQEALADKTFEWFEAERAAGRTPSVRRYWKAHPEEKRAMTN